MENFQHNNDYIVPEGFEFKEEYMAQAFEIYDNLKNSSIPKGYEFKEEYMNQAFEIYDNLKNSTIPEGFEFKEEYMVHALDIYDHLQNQEKKRKRYIFICSSSLLFISACITFFFLISDKKSISKENFNEKILSNQSESKYQLSKATNENKNKNQLTSVKDYFNQSKSKVKTVVASSHSKTTLNSKIFNNQLDEIRFSEFKLKSTIENSLNNVSQNVNDHLSNSYLQGRNSVIETNDSKILEFQLDSFSETDTTDNSSNLESLDDNSENLEISFTQIDSSDLIQKNRQLEKIQNLSTYEFRKHQFYIGLGLNTFYGYSSNTNHFGQDYSFDLGYVFNTHKRLSFGGSFEFFSVSNMNSIIEIEEKEYGFNNIVSKKMKFETKSLQYMSIKPELSYKFTKKNQISLAYGLEILTSGKNIISVSETQNNITTDISVTKERNYIQGYSKINHSVLFGYEFSLLSNFSLGVKYSLGLTDITRNEYFTKGSIDKNSRLIVGLKIKLN